MVLKLGDGFLHIRQSKTKTCPAVSFPQNGECWIRVRLAPPVDPRQTFSAGLRARRNPQ